MKKTHITYISHFLFACILAFSFYSCSNENESSTSDLFAITPEVRNIITEGVSVMPISEQESLYAKRDSLVNICYSDKFKYRKTDSLLQKTKEYIHLKSYMVANPSSYYILMDDFLRGDFNSILSGIIFQDLVEASFPGIISNVLDQLNGATTEEFIRKYPQLCVENILTAMNEKLNDSSSN